MQKMLDLLADKKYHTAIAHLISVYRAMLTLRKEICPQANDDIDQQAAVFEALLTDPDSLDEVRKVLDDLAHSLVSSARQIKKIQHETLMQQITDYINAAYADPNLNSQMLADHFHISTAYLCRVFRKGNNQSLAAYITRIRIKKACEMLRTTDEPIKSISCAVGLDNSQYFYVQFKQQMGMTPNEFREQSKANS